jgi:CHAT domain-containing protein
MDVQQFLPFDAMNYNKDEIASIKKWVGADLFEGGDATHAAFRGSATSHNTIHVSTHAFLNNADPAGSFLVFAQMRDTLQPEELLFLRDLNNYEPLDIELMVFTACQTALGQYKRGEGAMSMARGLATAGVKSYITTLWEVNQEKTAALIPGFYRHLAKGENHSKDLALAESKREFMSGSALKRYPCYWAGLVVSGDMKPIGLEGPDFQWGIFVSILGLLAALGLLWWRRRQRKA